MNKKFYEILKEKRVALGLSLREFCKIADEDPSNYSRIERGIRVPPCNDVLERYGKALKLSGKELQNFISTGSLFRRELPKNITDEELAKKLPALLRLIDGEMPEKKNLEAAVKITKKAFHS